MPGAPTGVSGVAGNGQVTVSWTAPASTGGSPVTGYVVTGTPAGSCAAVAPLTSCVVSGLTNGVGHTFTVVASNVAGAGAASSASGSVTPRTVPGAPTGVSGVAGNGQVTVSWTAPTSDGGSAVTGYVVTGSPAGSCTAVAPATSCVVSGLTNGVGHTFTVVASNVAGPGAASAVSGSVTPRTVPGAPTAVTGVAGNGQVTVSWTPPTSDGGSAVTGYVVTGTPTGSCSTAAVESNPVATSCVVSGLTNGAGHTFTVVASNVAGAGAASLASGSVTPRTVPDAPTGVSGVAGDGQVTVSWTAPASTGGSPVTGYVVTGSPAGSCSTAAVESNPVATSCVVSGLTNGVGHTFTVVASNVAGSGAASLASGSVTPRTVPDAPTGVSGVAGDGQVTVSWTAPVSDGGSAVTGYVVTGTPGGSCSTEVSGLNPVATSCVVSGLTNGTGHTFTVVASNVAGSGVSSEPSESVTPRTVPDAPTGATGVPGDGQVTVLWTAPVSDGGSPVTGYVVTGTPAGSCTAVAPTTSCVVSGLTNGTGHTFTVVASNVAGAGAASSASGSVTPRTVPGAPTGVAGVAGNGQVTVSWTAPVSDGGSAVTGYVVTGTPGGSCSTEVSGLNPVATSCVVSGLTNGVGHTFTVVASNVAGAGAASSASGSVTPRTVPGAPTGVSGVAGNGQVTVSWTAPVSDGGSAVTGYVVTGAPGGSCEVAAPATSCVVSGLTNGTGHTFTVVASNVAGSGAASLASGSVTPRTVPGAPTGVAGVAGNGQVTVSWTAPVSDGGSAVTGYVVTGAPGGSCSTEVSGLNPVATSCVVSGLTNGTGHTFTVVASNVAGSGAASLASGSVTPRTVPGAPTGVAGVAGNGQVTVSWTAPISDGGSAVTGYVVTGAPGGSCSTEVSGLNPVATSCVVSGLTNGTGHTFTVVASNVAGAGAASLASGSVTPRTVPGAPTGVTGVAGNGQVTVSWTAPISDGGSAVTGYVVTGAPGGSCSTEVSGLNPVATSCVVSGLTNGTGHTFTVVASNVAGAGAASLASGSVTPRTVPDAPTGATGVPGNGQVTVSWTAPVSDGGSAVTGYVVTGAPGGSCEVAAPATSCVVSGLTNGTGHTFTVVASNVAGAGAASSASGSVTPRTVPDAPTGVTGVAGDGQVTVSWTAPAVDGGSAVTGYVVTGSPAGSCEVAAPSTSCVVSGLTNGTGHTFTVVASNVAGAGAASSASGSVTPRTVPGAPTGVSGVAGNGQVTVSWTAPGSTGGSPVTGFVVTGSPAGSCEVAAPSTSCVVSGLTNGTGHTFTVVASNVAGAGAASSVSGSVTPRTVPDAPTGVSGVAGDGEVTVSWTAPTSDGGSAVTGYAVTGTPAGSCTAVAPATSCVVSGLTNGTAHTFTVVASNVAGSSAASPASGSVTPRTVPGAPTGVAGVAGDGQVTVSWTAPASSGGSPVTGYVVTGTPGGSCTAVAPLTSCVVSGLTNGTGHTFTVVASNVAGAGVASSVSGSVTPRTVPGAPTGVAGVPGNGQVTVSWTAPVSDGGSAVTGYVVTGAPGGSCEVAAPLTSCVVSGLTNGTGHTFTVVASNVAGSGVGSEPSGSVTPRTVPGAPTGVSGVAGDGQVIVSWTAPASTGGSPVTGYVVTGSPAGSCTAVAPATSCVVSGLTNGTGHTFTVVASNVAGCGCG